MGRIVALDTTSGRIAIDFANKKDGEGANLHFSPCGSYVVDASWDGDVFIRDVNSGKVVYSKSFFPHQLIGAIHRTRNGKLWVIKHGPKLTEGAELLEPEFFSVWTWPFDMCNYRVIDRHFSFPMSSALSDDGELLAVVHGVPPRHLDIIRIADGSLVSSIQLGNRCWGLGLAWSPDARILASVQEGKVAFYSAPDYELFSEISIPRPSSVAFSPDGTRIALGSGLQGCSWKRVTSVP